MAIVMNAAADRLLRTADLLSYNSAYTVMCWFRPVEFPVGNGIIFCFNPNTTANYDAMYCLSNRVLYIEQNHNTSNWTNNTGGTTLTHSVWSHVAMVRESTTSFKAFLNGVQDGTTVTASVASRSTANTRFECGAMLSTDSSPTDSSFCAFKAWSAALTAAEISEEMYCVEAVRTDNLHMEVHLDTSTDVIDYSGNGRDFTGTGLADQQTVPPLGHNGRFFSFPISFTEPGGGGGSIPAIQSSYARRRRRA